MGKDVIIIEMPLVIKCALAMKMIQEDLMDEVSLKRAK